MFKHIEDTKSKELVSITIDNQAYKVPKGHTVAGAMLLLGANIFRSTPVENKPRGPFCMMGVCFDCLISIDGLSDQQACMTLVEEGMNIKCQEGPSVLFSRDKLSDGAVK